MKPVMLKPLDRVSHFPCSIFPLFNDIISVSKRTHLKQNQPKM